MVSPDQVEAMIKVEIPDAQVQVLTSDGEHYEVIVVSPVFEGKRLVQQHQLVYNAIQTEMLSGAIHAMAVKTYTLKHGNFLSKLFSLVDYPNIQRLIVNNPLPK